MSLQKQTYRINFGQGLDTKSDPKILSSGKMTVLKNAQFINNNRLSKRNGFSAVGTTSSAITVSRIDYFGNSIFAFGESTIGSTPSVMYLDQRQATPVYNKAFPSLSDCTVSASMLLQGTTDINNCDLANCNGFTIYAGYDKNTFQVIIRILNESSGEVIRNFYINASLTNSQVRCLAINNTLLAGINCNNGTINVQSFDTANSFNVVSTTYSSASSTSSLPWDWTAHSISGTFCGFMAYNSSLSNVVRIAKISADGSSLATTAFTAATTIGTSICCVQPVPSTVSGTFKLVFSDTAQRMYGISYNTSLAVGYSTTSSYTTVGTIKLITSIDGTGQTSDSVFVTSQTSNVYGQATTVSTQNSSGTFTLGSAVLQNYGIYSKPIWKTDSITYFWTLYPSSIQSQYQMVQFIPGSYSIYGINSGSSSFVPTARILEGEAIGDSQVVATTNYGGISLAVGVYNSSSSVWISAAKNVSSLSSIGSTGLTEKSGITKLSSDFGTINNHNSVEINNQKIFAGGMITQYDKTGLYELGFLTFPEYLSGTPANGSGTMTAGVYQYIAIYEYTDDNGNISRSETSVPISVTVSGTQNQVALSLLSLPSSSGPPLTAKGIASAAGSLRVSTAWYRTTNAASPQIFYRIGSGNLNAFTDTVPDSIITAGSILYTQGGIADNFTVDGSNVICAGPDRLFAASPSDNGIVRVGKPFNETESISFFSGITIQIPSSDGPITNMKYIDSSLIIFKESSIYVVQGQGPTPNGQNNGYSPCQTITKEVGCDGPNSATIYPDGILFKSSKGYFKLGRDLSFAASSNYIGAPVESFNASSCRRALTCMKMNECRFVLDDSQTVLVYNYYFDQWSTIITSVNDMVDANGVIYLASATPTIGSPVGMETIGTFVDALTNPTTIPFTIQTGWISLNNLQGCERIYRVRLLGDFKSTHTLNVQIAYDYESSFNETHTITSANITIGSSAYQCEFFPLRQKCESIRFQISDSSITGEDFDLTDMEIEVGIQPGRRFPLAAGKAF